MSAARLERISNDPLHAPMMHARPSLLHFAGPGTTPYCRSSPRASSGCTRAQYARGVVDNTCNQCSQSTHRSPDDDHAGDLARQPRRPECTRRRRLKVALDAPEKKEKKSRAQPMLARGPVPTRAARVKNPFLETGWWQHAARVAHSLETSPRTTCIFFKVFLSFAKTPRGFPNKTC